jgi:hypothetical protein
MVTVEAATLWLHIAAGVVAVLAGLGAMVTTKGGRRHRRAGVVFVAAMGVVVGTVVPLAAIDPTQLRLFLVLVAVFSGYLAFSGYRTLSRKRPDDDATAVDWGGAALVVLACLALGGWGVSLLAGGDTFGTVMVVFGVIGTVFGGLDVRNFRREGGGEWLVDHLSRMVGAYIATVTAVSVVNLTMVPRVVAWLWPTAAGLPLILYWQGKYAGVGPLAGVAGD